MRILKILSVLLTHLVLYPLNSHRKESFGARLKKACRALGVVFIKIGQILSGRYDLFRESDLAELRKLLDDEEPLPDAMMFSVIAQELGRRAERLGSLTLLSSVSIAQVYRGLVDGKERIVVKVLKPGIRKQAEIDLAILYGLARIVQFFSPLLSRLEIAQAVRDMRSWILEETDFNHELQNILDFQSDFTRRFVSGRVREDLGRVIVPKIYPEFSTSLVLTMEELHGITVSDWIRGKRGADYDPRKSIMTLFVISFRPLFAGEPFLFHGDPHPANIFFMEGGDVGLVDFGLVGRGSEEMMPGIREMFFAAYLRDAPMFTGSLIRFLKISDERYEQILPDAQEFVKDAVDRGFGGLLIGLLKILRRQKLPAPTLLPIIGKYNLAVDSLAHRFCPGRSTVDMLREEFLRALTRKKGG